MSDVGRLLVDALTQHRLDAGDTYDETLETVVERAAAQKSLTKADIGSLVLWKRISAQTKWAKRLGMFPDATVRDATGQAWLHANNTRVSIPEAAQAARDALRGVPGLRGGTGALASAVLLACAPERMAIWDRRVSAALDALGRRPQFGEGFFRRYMEIVCSLVEEMQPLLAGQQVTPRHVDLALYRIGGSPDLLNRARAIGSGDRRDAPVAPSAGGPTRGAFSRVSPP